MSDTKTLPERAVLTFNLDEEYQIRIEEPKDFQKSYFKDVYSRAARAVADIIEQSSDKNGDLYPFIKESQDSNNIIAFVGNRGTGKTSVMVSFAKYLLGLKDEKIRISNFERERLSRKEYISLPTIDPSLFENHENIIEVVLAQMFSEFEYLLKKETDKIGQSKRREMLEQFEKVYERLQTIKKGSSNYDGEAIETLSKLGNSTMLRKEFKKLVELYVSAKTDSKDNFLIIPIDDFDLNVKSAAEMSEQIRKYFMIPNVIILMSVNMDQLKDAKELSIRKDYNGMVEYMREDPSELAVQYLLKLIPDNRRFYMPELKIHIRDTNIKIVRKKKKTEQESEKESILKRLEKLEHKSKDANEEIVQETDTFSNESESEPIEDYIINTIFKKTGLIYIPKQNKVHILTRFNLRRLTELVYFIEKRLADVEISKEKNINEALIKDKKRNNLLIFEDYLVYIYIPSILPKKYLNEYRKIIESDVQVVNYTTIHTFYNIIKEEKIKHKPELFTFEYSENIFPNLRNGDSNYRDELSELLNISNNHNSISLGDVLFMMNESDRIKNDNDFTLFCDSIKFYYSLIILKQVSGGITENVKAICGDSLLPNENLVRVVPLKEYYVEGNQRRKALFSRTSYSVDTDNIGKSEDLKDSNIYILFNIYSGVSYPYRRRSLKEFDERHKIEGNKNFTIDLFSVILNAYYLRDKLSIDEKKCSLIPFHSIDIIELVLYRYFAINRDELYMEIVQIFESIKTRINELVSRYEMIEDEVSKYIDESYILNNLIYDESFKNFVKKLEATTQSNWIRLSHRITYNEYNTYSNLLVGGAQANYKVSTFLQKNIDDINKFDQIITEPSVIRMQNLMGNQIKINSNIKMSEFREICKDEIENYLKWLRDSLNL